MAEIKHYGTPRHSGRYPWGSGKASYQRSKTFLSQVEDLKRQGLTELQIAEGMGMTTSELRKKKSLARAEMRSEDVRIAAKLKEKGYSNVAIGKHMGLNESSVRALLDPTLQERAEQAQKTADILRENVDQKRYLDVGAGVESHLGITRTKLDVAIKSLEEEGYTLHKFRIEQQGTGKFTIMKVLAPPGTELKEVLRNRDQVKMITDYNQDTGRTHLGLKPIRSLDSSRVMVRYQEDGGADKDGLIELRRGVDELNMGNARYAQVRIGVDGTHFMKGMAIYSDDIPDGYDVIYNSNKARGTSKDKVFKPMKDDPDNPFGAIVYQPDYVDANGKTQRSALNVVNEEGNWGEWSRTISSQVLSKQRPSFAKRQLDQALELKQEEFDEIASLTNPAVKKTLLDSFAGECDSASVHLKAAALPRQAAHVILPFPSIKENEVYAPGYEDGEPVVLIRHPHGGTFEIPELIVNNKNPEARRTIPQARDAVGINPKVAGKLSGADFDGDTVLVIPNRDGLIRTSPSIKSLEGFNPREHYKLPAEAPDITNKTLQTEMGKVSNLITDMTIKGASVDEIARAVRHSMVVIDSQKHRLDYKQSAVDNGIAALKKKYQGREDAGSATLISRAGSDIRVPHRTELRDPDPVTGEKRYKITGKTFVKRLPNKRGPYTIDANGEKVYSTTRDKVVARTVTSKKMAEVRDAFDLVSANGGTRMEAIYAEYANALKALGNRSRKLAYDTPDTPYSPSAKQAYRKEVENLKHKLVMANRNKPLERQAQLIANKIVQLKRQANPGMDHDSLKKIKGQALEEARHRVGAQKQKIEITDREWEAIQLGAVSNNTLKQILLNTDLETVKQRAMPRTSKGLSPARLARARTMLASGQTQSEIASVLGVSVNTLMKALS